MDPSQTNLILRTVFAAIFASAGIVKLVTGDRDKELDLLAAAGIRRQELAVVGVSLLPLAEIALAVWLISSWHTLAAMSAALWLMITFSVILTVAMRAGYQGSCACFGRTSGNIAGAIAFNGVIIAATSVALIHATIESVDSRSLRHLDTASAATVGGLLLSVMGVRRLLDVMLAVIGALGRRHRSLGKEAYMSIEDLRDELQRVKRQ
jgi:hypothetical protein